MLKFTNIGIDLGIKEIKIAEIGKVALVDSLDSELNHLKSYKSYPVNCEAYSEEYFKLLRKSIKDFAKTFKKGSLSLNFSIPFNKHANTLFLNVPSVDKKDLEDGIKFEAEQALALADIKDSQFTWKIINKYPELNENEVLIATINANIVKALSHFKTIQWKINRVMLQPVLLERFAKNNDIIIDFGYSNTRIYMYKEGKLSGVDQVSISAFTIDKKIESYLEDYALMNTEDDFGEIIDLEYMLNRIYIINNLIDTEENQIIEEASNLIKPLISKLLDEIKRIIRSFELQNGIDIDNIYYVGELANIKYFPQILESELELTTNPLSLITKDIEGNKYDLAGLTMMDPKLKDDTNFTKFIKANIDYTSILVAVLAITLSTGGAFKFLDDKYQETISVQVSQENQQNSTMDGLQNDINMARQSISHNQMFIDKISTLKSEKKWLSDILYVIPDITPTTIVIKDLDIVDKKIEIKGYGADYSSIGFFSAELEKIGNVDLKSITDFKHLSGDLFSVVIDKPEDISEKFLMTKTFSLTLEYMGDLLSH